MTDIENYVINQVSLAVTATYPNADVLGFYVDTPSSFPCVCIQMSDRETYTRSLDGDLQPHHQTVYFSVDTFSAAENGKKAEAKAIAKLVDDTMANMGFTLTMSSPTPNIDRSVYRITSRYRAVQSAGHTVGDDTVVHIYRN